MHQVQSADPDYPVGGTFTTSWKDKMGDADPADYYTSDITDYAVDWTDQKDEARLVDHEHSWSYTASGDTVTAVCGGDGRCPLGEQTAKLSLNKTTFTEGDSITANVTVSDKWTTANKLVAPPTEVDVKYVNKSGTASYAIRYLQTDNSAVFFYGQQKNEGRQ